MIWVLERREDKVGAEPKLFGGRFRKPLGFVDAGLARAVDFGNEIGVFPDRHAVLAPIEAEGPARQTFAGITFSLPIMQKPAWGEARVQAADQLVGETTLGRADGGDIPLRRFH